MNRQEYQRIRRGTLSDTQNLFVLHFGRKFTKKETHLHSKRIKIVFVHNIQEGVRKKSIQEKNCVKN